MPEIIPSQNTDSNQSQTTMSGMSITAISRLGALFSLMIFSYATATASLDILGHSSDNDLNAGFASLAVVFFAAIIGIITFTIDAVRKKGRGQFLKRTYIPTLIVVLLISFIIPYFS